MLVLALGIPKVLAAQGVSPSQDWSKPDSVARTLKGHSVSQYYNLARSLTRPFARDEDKFRAIYTWICENIENNYAFSVENRRMRDKYANNPQALAKWNKEFTGRVYKELITRKSTVCTGYAWLLREMSKVAGIQCEMIDGYARTIKANIGGSGVVNHTWNVVNLNGGWYLCDPTWSSGAIDIKNHVSIQEYDPVHFLAKPEQFVRDHYPMDTAWMFMGVKPTLRDFLDRPLTYRAAYRYGINQFSPGTFELTVAKSKSLIFKFNKPTAPDTARVEMEIRSPSGSKEGVFSPTVVDDGKGQLSIEYAFTFKGKYDVHLMLGSEHIVTYVVTVVK